MLGAESLTCKPQLRFRFTALANPLPLKRHALRSEGPSRQLQRDARAISERVSVAAVGEVFVQF